MSTEKHNEEYFEKEGAKELAQWMRSSLFEDYPKNFEEIDHFITANLSGFLASYDKHEEENLS